MRRVVYNETSAWSSASFSLDLYEHPCYYITVRTDRTVSPLFLTGETE